MIGGNFCAPVPKSYGILEIQLFKNVISLIKFDESIE